MANPKKNSERGIENMGTAFASLSAIADGTVATFVVKKTSKKSWGDYAKYQAENIQFCVPSALSPNSEEFPEKIQISSGKVIEVDD